MRAAKRNVNKRNLYLRVAEQLRDFSTRILRRLPTLAVK
jgi:hypothetical protein